MDAAASPLPREETTPPETKMYFVRLVGVFNVGMSLRLLLSLRVSPSEHGGRKAVKKWRRGPELSRVAGGPAGERGASTRSFILGSETS